MKAQIKEIPKIDCSSTNEARIKAPIRSQEKGILGRSKGAEEVAKW